MFIQVNHEDGISCYDAVCDALSPMSVGDFIQIDGMAMGKRTIDVEVLRALIHASRECLHMNFRAELVKCEGGWSNCLMVVCTSAV